MVILIEVQLTAVRHVVGTDNCVVFVDVLNWISVGRHRQCDE
jgi:hypothetical protein